MSRSTCRVGALLVHDEDVRSQEFIALRRGIGYIIQKAGLFSHFTVERTIQIKPAIEALAGKITESDMRQMNEEVAGQHRDPAIVVREFRKEHGL
jgi:ABC-type proline/glycine betaine transport system ATPase subunit